MSAPEEVPGEGDEALSGKAPSWLDAALIARALGVPRVTTCDVSPATGKGDNYASVVYKCTARAPKSGGGTEEEEEEYRLFVKCLPSNALRQMFSNKIEVFRKERDIYSKILPRYEEMLSKVQPGRTSFPWPQHYASEVDGKRDYIVFKDLGPQGFRMAQRLKGLDEHHLALALSALGEFHACSVAFEALGPADEFQAEVVTPFRDIMYSEEAKEMAAWMQKGTETVAPLVEAWGGRFEAIGRWIMRWAPKVHGDMRALLAPTDGALLCHGDAWLNNMLFRYEGDRPLEVKLLDFQIARYSSPASDLMYLMVTSTTADTRRQHWDHLLEHKYLRSFWKTLESLGIKERIRGDLYSLEWLRRETKRMTPWALANAILVLRAVVLDAKDAPDLDKLTEEDLKAEVDVFKGTDDSAFQERLRGLICEFAEEGLFES